MKKGIVSVVGIALAILFIFVGIFIGMNITKINMTSTTQTETQNESEPKNIADLINAARLKAATLEDRNNQRVEIENIGKSKYQSIVILQDTSSDDGYGTGFIVGKNKILTNKHVTEESENNLIARLRDENGEFIDFKVTNVINAPNGSDLSVVEVAPNDAGQNIGDNIKILELASQEEINNVKVGDFIHTVGYPGDKEFSTLWYSPGKMLYTNGSLIFNDSRIAGGSSGSPILNKDEKIIGLVNASSEDHGKVLTYGFLLDKELYEFVKSNI